MGHTWELVQKHEEFLDYELPIPNVRGHGGRIRLTIKTEEKKAYITLVLDNDYGDEFLTKEIADVSLSWALAVAYGIDGFIMPTSRMK